MHITVLMGGTSSERNVSLVSGLRVAEALRSRGHTVVAVDTARGPVGEAEERALLASGVGATPPDQAELDRMHREALRQTVGNLPKEGETDVAFLALHGGAGEDGTVQALLDLTGVPYTGSGHLASALAMDKELTKRVFRDAGVPTADWLMAPPAGDPTREAFLEDVAQRLGVPVIVKPSKQGSTVGLSLVKKLADLEPAIDEAFRYDDEVMVEAFVPGRELTVAILGGEALPVGEIIPQHEIYDYECKYTAGMADERFPAELTEEEAATVQEHARLAFTALKLRGVARIDFRMNPAGEFYCLEANTLPGMTGTSLVPQAAVAAGMDFPEFCERIATLALRQG